MSRKTKKNIPTFKHNLPDMLAMALFYGETEEFSAEDFRTLAKAEREANDEAVAFAGPGASAHCVDVSEESFFGVYEGVGHTMYTYTFQVIKA